MRCKLRKRSCPRVTGWLPSLTTCTSKRARLVPGPLWMSRATRGSKPTLPRPGCTGPRPAPADLAVLGSDVWRADKPLAERGLLVLASALGSAEFVAAHGGERARAEEDLLQPRPPAAGLAVRVAPAFSIRLSLAPLRCCPQCQGARRSNLDYGPRFVRKPASRGRGVKPRARLGITASA